MEFIERDYPIENILDITLYCSFQNNDDDKKMLSKKTNSWPIQFMNDVYLMIYNYVKCRNKDFKLIGIRIYTNDGELHNILTDDIIRNHYAATNNLLHLLLNTLKIIQYDMRIKVLDDETLEYVDYSEKVKTLKK